MFWILKYSMLSRTLLLFAAASFLVGAMATVFDVVLRATTGGNLSGVIELTTLSIGFGALLSIPVCYHQNTHVSARLLSELNPTLFARPLGFFGALFSLLFAALLAVIMTLYAINKWGGPETSPDMQLPMDMLLAITALAFVAALVAVGGRIIVILRGELSDG
ncbi:MAG: TRAP-type C4-dicarboxylate transport system permease small subunit [bacterium]|jgi:TRAP-type C4-dicarboxylate transport system permease small subunit